VRRFALVVMPIFAVVTSLIGVYFIYVGCRIALSGRSVAVGLGFAAFGAAGFLLAYALWSMRRQLLARLGEAGVEEGRR
jgi:hypothetical protein